MKALFLAVVGIFAVATNVSGDELVLSRRDGMVDVLRPARELNVRDGIGRSAEKLKAGGDFSIAYLGGSITMQNGWRVICAGTVPIGQVAC